VLSFPEPGRLALGEGLVAIERTLACSLAGMRLAGSPAKISRLAARDRLSRGAGRRLLLSEAGASHGEQGAGECRNKKEPCHAVPLQNAVVDCILANLAIYASLKARMASWGSFHRCR